MLRLCEYDYTQTEPILSTVAILHEAKSVRVSHEINGDYTLSFDIPYGDDAMKIKCNQIIDCEGQLFRIMSIGRNASEQDILNVEAWHIYIADAKFIYFENIGLDDNYIGANPHDVMSGIFEGTAFHVLTDDEADALGLTNIGADGFKIDFESTDKITAFEAVEKILECCGKGELYLDNYNISLVERIGDDIKINFDISDTMTNIDISEDITEMITRLYVYGNDDSTIYSIMGQNYIDSDYIGDYGIRAGYKSYEYTNTTDLCNAGLFDFGKQLKSTITPSEGIIDIDNPYRIDIPSINISGSFVDLSGISKYGDCHKLKLGDGVTVNKGKLSVKERIIRMEYYPYEPELGTLSIGRVKKDLYFYFKQMNKKIKKASKQA